MSTDPIDTGGASGTGGRGGSGEELGVPGGGKLAGAPVSESVSGDRLDLGGDRL